MNKLMTIIAAVLSLCLLAPDADAKRLGGGTSIGKQRTITQPAATPPAQQAPAATPATPAPQPSGMSRWLGPLAGLAHRRGTRFAVHGQRPGRRIRQHPDDAGHRRRGNFCAAHAARETAG